MCREEKRGLIQNQYLGEKAGNEGRGGVSDAKTGTVKPRKGLGRKSAKTSNEVLVGNKEGMCLQSRTD